LSQDGRPGQQQAANNGQRRFHVLSIIQLAESSSTAFGSSCQFKSNVPADATC
jgi:hypothetical protein